MATGREYPDRPFVGVGALVHKDGKVLLVRRSRQPNSGKWLIPGGIVELGEQLEEAVKREVKEELGLDAEVEGVLGTASEVIRDAENKVRFHYVLIDYLVAPRSEKVVLNEESSAFEWFSPQRVEELDTTPNTKKMVRAYLTTMGRR